MYHLCMLIFALLITGANLPAGSADAQTADTTSDVEKLVFEFTAAGENDGHDGDTNEGIVTKLNGEVVDFYGHDGDEAVDENNTSTSSRTFFSMKIANQIAKMKRPVYKVTSLTDGATLKLWDFCWEGMWTIGDQTGNINNSYIKDGEFLGTQKRNTVVIDYKLGETEIGIDLSGEYEDGETPEPPAWNGDTFLGFGLDFGASATIEIYDTAEEEIEPSLLPEQSSTPAPPVATPSLEPSFRPAVISTVAPLPEQSNIPAGVPGSNVTPEQSSVPSVSKKVKVSGRKYNSQRLTFRVKGKKKGNTVIYVIIGEKSRKIKVICL